MNLLEQKIAWLENEVRSLKSLTEQLKIIPKLSDRTINNALFDSITCDLPIYADNAAAVADGHEVGKFYRTDSDPDTVCVVH